MILFLDVLPQIPRIPPQLWGMETLCRASREFRFRRGEWRRSRLKPCHRSQDGISTETPTPARRHALVFSDHNGSKSSGPNKTYCARFGYNGQLMDIRKGNKVSDELKKNVRPDLTLNAYVAHDWENDPFSKGTWCTWGPNYTTRYLAELQKPHGRVYMASGDWASGFRGFIDGGIESGIRAATDVKRAFGSGPSSF